MTDGFKLSALTALAGSMSASDTIYVVSGGLDRKALVSQIRITASQVSNASTIGLALMVAANAAAARSAVGLDLTAFPGFVLSDAQNIAAGSVTGTKIGTATSQMLSLWNKTPIVQPTNAITAAAFVANTSAIVDDSATYGGYTIGQIAAALIAFGVLA